MIDGRIAIATTANIGNKFPVKIGDYLDVSFKEKDGTIKVYHCIRADTKNTSDKDCTCWGHMDGKNVVEVIYDKIHPPKDQGYITPDNDPWGKGGRVIRITKVGDYGVNLE